MRDGPHVVRTVPVRFLEFRSAPWATSFVRRCSGVTRLRLESGVLWERQLRDQRRSSARRALERHCPAGRLDSVLQPYETRAASWGLPRRRRRLEHRPRGGRRVVRRSRRCEMPRRASWCSSRSPRRRNRRQLRRFSDLVWKSHLELHRDGRTSCESPQRRGQSAVGQGGRVQPGSDRAQFLKNSVEIDRKASKLGVQTSGLRGPGPREQPSPNRARRSVVVPHRGGCARPAAVPRQRR